MAHHHYEEDQRLFETFQKVIRFGAVELPYQRPPCAIAELTKNESRQHVLDKGSYKELFERFCHGFLLHYSGSCYDFWAFSGKSGLVEIARAI